MSGYDRDQDDQDNGDGENNVILLHGRGNRSFTILKYVNIRKNILLFKYDGHRIQKKIKSLNLFITKKGPPRQAAPTIPWLLKNLITEFNLMPDLDDLAVLAGGFPLWSALQVFDQFTGQFLIAT